MKESKRTQEIVWVVKAHSVLWGQLLLPPFCSIWCKPKDCSLNLMLRSLGFLSEFHRILESQSYFSSWGWLKAGLWFFWYRSTVTVLDQVFWMSWIIRGPKFLSIYGIAKFRGLDIFFRIWMILDWHIVFKNLLHTKGQSQTDTGGSVEICSDVDQ